MPVGARSSRPGETIVAWRASPPTRGGATKTTKERYDSAGSSGWVTTASCSVACGRIRSPSSASARASSGTISNPSAVASTNAHQAPP